MNYGNNDNYGGSDGGSDESRAIFDALEQCEEAFQTEAEPAVTSWANQIPDGEYAAVIDGLELVYPDKSPCPILKWKLTVSRGDFRGSLLEKASFLDPDRRQSMGYFKRELRVAMGGNLPLNFRLKQLPKEMAEIVANRTELKVALVTSKGKGTKAGEVYKNIYINEFIGQGAGGTGGAGGGVGDGGAGGIDPADDDIPF